MMSNKVNKQFVFYIALFFLIITNSYGQQGEWTWIHGSNSPSSFGNFGVQGVASPTNEPPALYEPCEWIDLSGNFWLYGGKNANQISCSDLWRYDPTSNEWTWMKGTGNMNQNFIGNYGTVGVPSATNNPPGLSYGIPTWVDNQGNLWLLSGQSNRMWKYNVLSNMWTCMTNNLGQIPTFGIQGVPDSTSSPGACDERTSTWTDNAGNLWLFGGQCFNIGNVDLMWRFNTVTCQWTWVKGSTSGNQSPVYGTLGVEDPLNTPGSRWGYSHWKDYNGNFWLFGGAISTPGISPINDLWKYNPITNNWTWMGGSNIPNEEGVYGTQCNASLANIPASRFENRAVFTDSNSNFWMWGGCKDDLVPDVLNDLWMYNISINQWLWVSGDSTINPVGSWGALGVSSPSNIPSGRSGAIMWGDNDGNLFVFGGAINNFTTTPMNDLWKFAIDTLCISTSINDLNNQNHEVSVAPNPTNGILTITVKSQSARRIKFSLINLFGEVVLETDESRISDLLTHTINLNRIPNGIYFLKIFIDKNPIIKKVVKY